MTIPVLIIDDDQAQLTFLAAAVEQQGIEVVTCPDPEAAIEIVRSRHPRIVLCDLVMPRLTGLDVLDRITEIDPSIDVILLTGYYTVETAVEAIRRGAADYLTKPIAAADLRKKIEGFVSEWRRRERAGELDDAVIALNRFHGMIGRSPAMTDVFGRIARIAPHYRTALITGETGTGKELAARALHAASPVPGGPFIVCNCAALPETLIESELFGHSRGAFTGATQDKPGLFELAHGGTILLDEIGEMSPGAQAKVLRAIQYQELQRVGSTVLRRSDFRLIAATHRDLRSMVTAQRFREDLLYRLAMVEVRMPALRERLEDLPLLIRHFTAVFAGQYRKKLTGFTRRAEAALSRYSWPGNVRELEGAIGSAAMMTEQALIDVGDLPPRLLEEPLRTGDAAEDVLIPIHEAQRRHARRVLGKVGHDKAAAARVLGVSRATLYRLISEKKVPAPRSRGRAGIVPENRD
jgi:two-component system, NtrC family, response regulator HydG